MIIFLRYFLSNILFLNTYDDYICIRIYVNIRIFKYVYFYAPQNIYTITRKVYASIKVSNISCELNFTPGALSNIDLN